MKMDLFHLWRKAGLNSNHKFLELNWLELIVIEMIIKMSAIAVALLSGQASTPEWEGAVEPSRHAGVGGRAKQARRSGRVLSRQASKHEWVLSSQASTNSGIEDDGTLGNSSDTVGNDTS